MRPRDKRFILVGLPIGLLAAVLSLPRTHVPWAYLSVIAGVTCVGVTISWLKAGDTVRRNGFWGELRNGFWGGLILVTGYLLAGKFFAPLKSNNAWDAETTLWTGQFTSVVALSSVVSIVALNWAKRVKSRANKLPLPTPTDVTPAADAPVAPAPGAADR